MNVQKFIAADARDALEQVKAALGDDAIILSNRRTEEGVELAAMAASELSLVGMFSVPKGDSQQLAQELLAKVLSPNYVPDVQGDESPTGKT